MGLGATKELEKKIRSLKTTKKIVKITELSNLSKLGRYREAAEKSVNYYETILNSMNQLSQQINFKTTKEQEKKVGVIVVTSNRGFCGSYNLEVFRKLEKLEHKLEKKGIEIEYIVIGQIGERYLNSRGKEVAIKLNEPLEAISYKQAVMITVALVNLLQTGRIDGLHIIYTKYFSPVKSEAMQQKIYPYQEKKSTKTIQTDGILDFEESETKVKTILLENYMSGLLYSMLLYSIASEYCARRIAMKNANDSISEKLIETTYLKNKSLRQHKGSELIDIITSSKIIRKGNNG